MTSLKGWPAIAAVALIIAGLVTWRLVQKPAADADPPAPSALVSATPVRFGPVSQTLEAYGVIQGAPDASRTVSAPRDVIVQQLLVAPGQPVRGGTPLMVIGDTPASGLAFHQASDALAFASRDLARVQRLYDQQLAAGDQLSAAQKAVADARGGLAAQTAAGGGQAHQTLVSPAAGIVGQIPVMKGQQVAAGAALLTLTPDNGLVAQLGIEPNRAGQLAVGQSVRLASALDPKAATTSRLTLVGRAVDPTTHLISVSAPAAGAGLALGAAVRGEITVSASQGFSVPAASVVYDEAGAHVFIIAGGKARQIAVTPGADQGDQIAVSGALHAGDPVAVEGAYQLQDGMAVRTAK